MDPSREICKIRSSFNDRRENNIKQKSVKKSVKKYSSKIRFSPKSLRKNGKRKDDRRKNDRRKDNVNREERNTFQEIPLSLSDPYTTLEHSQFSKRESVVLANIDAVFNITNQYLGYIIKQLTDETSFVTLNDYSGAYTEYLQYRLPNSNGFVECENVQEKLNTRVLNVFNENEKMNKIDNNYREKYIDYIRSTLPAGVDIVVINSENMIKDLIFATNCLKTGGKLVIRLNDIREIINIKNIYQLSEFFKTITIFNPISIDVMKEDYYLIGEDYVGNNYGIEEYMKKIVDIPNDFQNYIDEYKTSLNNLREELYQNWERGKEKVYDMYTCKAIWNIS